MPVINSPDVSITTEIHSLSAVKLDNKVEAETINFDVSAKLDEKERKSGKKIVAFIIEISTKPSLAKFEIKGNVTLTGKEAQMEKLLEIDPETKLPFLLYRVYQQIFMAIYLLATIIDMPYPPPDLLHSEKIEEQNITAQAAPEEETIETA
ncbi:MAG: hypothetical protein QXN63_00310 [Candidatus Bathyarchaeia archaeon]